MLMSSVYADWNFTVPISSSLFYLFLGDPQPLPSQLGDTIAILRRTQGLCLTVHAWQSSNNGIFTQTSSYQCAEVATQRFS